MTKVWKSKIWDDSFLAFSVGFVVVYSVFSVGAVITEIFADQNRQFCKFPNKTKNGRFRTAKFGPKKWFFLLFLPPILFACPRGTFWTPKLWSGTQNEDFQRWSPSDQKWSFLIILTSKVPVKSPVRFSTTPLASLAGLNKQAKCLNWHFEYIGEIRLLGIWLLIQYDWPVNWKNRQKIASNILRNGQKYKTTGKNTKKAAKNCQEMA